MTESLGDDQICFNMKAIYNGGVGESEAKQGKPAADMSVDRGAVLLQALLQIGLFDIGCNVFTNNHLQKNELFVKAQKRRLSDWAATMAPKMKRKSSSGNLAIGPNTKKPKPSENADCPSHVLRVGDWQLSLERCF